MTEQDRLPERAIRWVLQSACPEDDSAVIASVSRLKGGISSIVQRITIRKGDGGTQDCVLRRYNNRQWLAEEPDLPLHEASSLEAASRLALPVPRVVAFDESGESCGMPAVLMTMLAGEVMLTPPDKARWLDELAGVLARIHAGRAEDFPWRYFTYQNLPTLETPDWSERKAEWRHAIDSVQGPQPAYTPVFIHRDYHPNNVLWQEERIVGIVDWVNACRGPAGVDVGHCRVNLAQLYGVEEADAFLEAYRRHAGSAFAYEPYWDLLSLADILFGPPAVYEGWTEVGYTGLTDDLIADRLDAYMVSLVTRTNV